MDVILCNMEENDLGTVIRLMLKNNGKTEKVRVRDLNIIDRKGHIHLAESINAYLNNAS